VGFGDIASQRAALWDLLDLDRSGPRRLVGVGARSPSPNRPVSLTTTRAPATCISNAYLLTQAGAAGAGDHGDLGRRTASR